MHWHGMAPSLADGHPQQAIPPGGSYPYQFPIMQRACLNWYGSGPAIDGRKLYYATDTELHLLRLPARRAAAASREG